MSSKPRDEIHISDVAVFLGCRLKWDYSSGLRQNLMPKRPNKHLWVGQGIHHSMAAYYGSGPMHKDRDPGALLRAFNAWCDREFERINQLIDGIPSDLIESKALAQAMLKHYQVWIRTNDDFEMVMPEMDLRVPIEAPGVPGGAFTFVGGPDGLIRTPEDELLWLEHKSYSHMPAYNTLALAPQGVAYTWAARRDPAVQAVGYVQGALYNVLRKSAPKMPTVLQNGQLSRAKNQKLSPELYLAVVKARKLDPALYIDAAANLKRDSFFRRYTFKYPEGRVRVFERQLFSVARDMLAEEPNLYPPDPMRSCDYCDFRGLCELRLYDQDWRALAEAEFISRDDAGAISE